MPFENLEEEGLKKNPNLELAQWKFLLSLDDHRDDKTIKTQLLTAISDNDMTPFYEEVCKEFNWPVDEPLLRRMKSANEAKIKTLDETIEDAEKNLGEMEVRDANLSKAEYLCQIGDKDAAVIALQKIYEKTVSLGHRMDIIFHLVRIGLFYMDHDLITRNIDKAKSLIEEGGDWDRRNRLKVYQGVYCIATRDFKGAASFFLETVSTFTSYELMPYKDFVLYTVYVCMISLPRTDLREIVEGSEILEVLRGCPNEREYLISLYNCQYGQFFKKLAYVEQQLKMDRLFSPHYRYYVREMRILAYTQLLESYHSLTLQYMADLIEQMSNEGLIDDLCDGKILDSEMKAEIEKQPHLQRSTLLLEAVLKSSNSEAMQCFLEALKLSNEHLYKLLTTKDPVEPCEKPQIPQPPIPQPSSPRKSLNERQIWQISDFIKSRTWRRFGRELGFLENDLDEIAQNYGDDFKESSHRMLIRFRERNPDKCNIENLYEALKNAGMENVAIEVKTHADTAKFQSAI